MNYLKMLVEDFHSVVIATIDESYHPVTRVIDMMIYDANTVYFLTARGKAFYAQLMRDNYASLSAVKGKKAISLKGIVENIKKDKLDEIFLKNPYMQSIYPKDTRDVLEVFKFVSADGEYFDISNPSKIFRKFFSIGKNKINTSLYRVLDGCDKCEECIPKCPQGCITLMNDSIHIEEKHCLHCNRCVELCPRKAIKKMR